MLDLSPARSKDADAIIEAFLPAHAWGEGAVAALVQRLRRNKYPLLALEDAAKNHRLLAHSVRWVGALAEDESNLMEQRVEFMKVRRGWLDAGIPSVLFKSGGLAPSFPYTSDNVDVLIPRNRTAEARSILMAQGYVWLHNIDEEQKWLFRKFRGGRSVSAIHVHGWVGWDVEFHERAIWDGVRQSPDDRDVMVPSREDAVLINAAHALYENKEIRLYDLEKIRAHWGEDLDWDYIEGIARRRGWLDGLCFALLLCQKLERQLFGYRTVPGSVVKRWRRGLRQFPVQYAYWKKVRNRAFAMPFRISFAFSKLLYYKKIAHDTHDNAGKRISNAVRTLAWGLKQKSGIRPQPGRVIALSGLDGAGKTAHAKALKDALETSEVITRTVWTRCGCSHLYRAISAVARRLGVGNDIRHERRVGTNASPLRGLKGHAWAWLNALDLALVYQARVRFPILTGKVVIADRYTTDAAVEIAHRLGADDPMSIPAVRALVALAPRPHSAYLLDLPAEIAAYRSADPEDENDLARQRELYRRAADAQKLTLLDVSGGFMDSNGRLVREALQSYENDFATLTNGMFLSNPDQLNPDLLADQQSSRDVDDRRAA
jgi:thymidylate kinase